MKTNKKLQNLLILQSFLPLAFLLLVKYFDFDIFRLSGKFFNGIFHKDFSVIVKSLDHTKFFIIIVMVGSFIWLVRGLIAIMQLHNVQNANFIEGDKIKISAFSSDAGLIFLMTFILPLLIDNIGEIRNFLVFSAMLLMVILLMKRTNLCYQNPVLIILGYKTFMFRSDCEKCSLPNDQDFIGITYGEIDDKRIIKYQLISANIYLVYNKNQRVTSEHNKLFG